MAGDASNTFAIFFGHTGLWTYLSKPEALNLAWALESLKGAFKDPDAGATPKTD